MSDKKLLQCPICGGEIKQMFMSEETFVECVWDESIGNASTWFKCYECDSEYFHNEPIDTPEKQVEWWNTRVPMQKIVERLEEDSKHWWKMKQEALKFNKGDLVNRYDAFEIASNNAIDIVKEEGGLND
jgi:hypothetical protein